MRTVPGRHRGPCPRIVEPQPERVARHDRASGSRTLAEVALLQTQLDKLTKGT
ncbi:hypothetical protein L1857_12600 [Amycolatopsis thermalba]|uniref:Transposase n=1 Tax=Amycolatopsis thermalba TaxID=944492 RepID=A0ABY4NU49_9PSEU|nr:MULTISPECIES: hypothetical protein [Amycolatopsis]UQS23604.1 hypothetical protein L1857_12600 [Amycolatopsis thermalba]